MIINTIMELIDAISKEDHIRIRRRNHIISLGNKNSFDAFILHEGVIALHRIDDDVLMCYLNDPVILGLNIHLERELYYIKPCTDIKFETCPVEYALEKIEENNVWRTFALYQMLLIYKLMNNFCNFTSIPTKDIIINCLRLLQKENEVIRQRQTALDYTINRTGLSKSTIMSIFADLRKEGQLKLFKGMLINPTDFKDHL
ncbi:helix-turn-helix domain-containing protein [Buttiauxella agrestis]|uniref:helix-turn-helix domain-containing protein n=1 Tax=Buttiauxella agrestis TaxID=82977 RepID=UPI0039764BD6